MLRLDGVSALLVGHPVRRLRWWVLCVFFEVVYSGFVRLRMGFFETCEVSLRLQLPCWHARGMSFRFRFRSHDRHRRCYRYRHRYERGSDYQTY